MLQYVNVTIDGAPVRAEKGTSVLDTAIHVGVCIPHLCHIPGIHDMGACRLCIVVTSIRRSARSRCACRPARGDCCAS